MQIESRTRGKLILNKSQLNAQQTHQLGVKQIQPQMSTKKISLEKQSRNREYDLRSKGKINMTKIVDKKLVE